MIDTHCHLNLDAFRDDRDLIINSLEAAGIEAVVIIGTNFLTSELAVGLADKYKNVYATVGVYPTEKEELGKGAYELYYDKLKNNKNIVGVGETGIDLYWKEMPLGVQVERFRRHIKLAKEVDKPVVIHSRDAGNEVLKVLQEEECTKFVMHCYCEGVELVKPLLALGGYFSFAGNITYPKSNKLREIIKVIPDDRILTETDSPFLPPQGKRGERNTPLNVGEIVKTIAEMKELEIEVVDELTTKNARRFWGI